MKLLNLGCGQKFHKDWVNVDFYSNSEHVIAHNLLNGIPFSAVEFDVVYHSHVLEHFSKEDGKKFLAECFRVLKPGGIIRIAVPDLEQIVKNYLNSLEGALAGNSEAADNYDWMMLELYDQTVRNYSGGEMAKYFYQSEIKNEKFVFSRVGKEGMQLRENFLKSGNKNLQQNEGKPASVWKNLFSAEAYIGKIREILFFKELEKIKENEKYNAIGKFRLGGEIHQWMYDRYSLGKLLADTGFNSAAIKTAFESSVANWNDYQLESKDGFIYKPDSLFMEAQKLV